jgi:hypothetical protein
VRTSQSFVSFTAVAISRHCSKGTTRRSTSRAPPRCASWPRPPSSGSAAARFAHREQSVPGCLDVGLILSALRPNTNAFGPSEARRRRIAARRPSGSNGIRRFSLVLERSQAARSVNSTRIASKGNATRTACSQPPARLWSPECPCRSRRRGPPRLDRAGSVRSVPILIRNWGSSSEGRRVRQNQRPTRWPPAPPRFTSHLRPPVPGRMTTQIRWPIPASV